MLIGLGKRERASPREKDNEENGGNMGGEVHSVGWVVGRFKGNSGSLSVTLEIVERFQGNDGFAKREVGNDWI